jgi:hypothetical protein
VAHRWVERRRPASDAAALRWLKPAGVVLWYALSLPLLQLGLRPALEFYGALVGVRV